MTRGMRSIGEISSEAEAMRFGDYLYANGIANDVEEDGGTWTIWIHDDDLLEKAEAELAKFLTDVGDARYAQAGGQATRLRQQEAQAHERTARRQVDVRTQVFGQARTAPATLTFLFIGLSIFAAVYTKVGEDHEANSRLTITHYWVDGNYIKWNKLPELKAGKVWRAVTPMFLHFGFLHILFNMYWLFYLGGAMEGRLGLIRFGLFILLVAAFSNLGQFFVGDNPVFGGMSGVNYALFGYLWIRGNQDPSFGIQLDQGTITILLRPQAA